MLDKIKTTVGYFRRRYIDEPSLSQYELAPSEVESVDVDEEIFKKEQKREVGP